MTRKPTILHLGDPIKYNKELHERLASSYTIIRPTIEERSRPEFLRALQEQRWGQFSAIFRPFFGSGGETGRFDRELLPLLPSSLQVCASAGAGYDWADVDLMAERGILFCNGATAPSEAVADTALWYILSVFRNFSRSALAAKSLNPEEFREAHQHVPETAHNPRGHVLGIIGMGSIGFKLAKKAHAALGMSIHYYDIARKPEDQEAAVEATFCPTIEELVESSDCIVLVIPLAGQKVITAGLLSHFKQGSRFINVARGALVDEEALAEALESGRISAAGLDVHENEPNVNKRLAQMPNVTMTCHNGGGAVETRMEFERLAMENVDCVLTGRESLTPVNLHLMRRKS